jgi:hypothetical protein
MANILNIVGFLESKAKALELEIKNAKAKALDSNNPTVND